jgi:hypothetical protein
MDIHGNSEPNRQELTVPAPWELRYHELRAIEPDSLNPGDEVWGWFTEDLLQLEHPAGILIDAGWRPDGDPSGRFRLVVIRDQDWSNPLDKLETRSLQKLVSAVQRFTEEVNARFGLEPAPSFSQTEYLDLIQTARDPRQAASQVAHLEQVGALISLLEDERPMVRFAAVQALARKEDPAAGSALLDRFTLPDPDIEVRRALIRALGAVGHRPAAPMLANWLSNPDPEQRIASAWSLARLEALEALPQVKEAYAMERSRLVRPHLKAALQKLAWVKGQSSR